MPKIVDYGWANAWANDWGRNMPDVIADCKHVRKHTKVSKCVEKVTCVHCDYTYKVDSGD